MQEALGRGTHLAFWGEEEPGPTPGQDAVKGTMIA
jgi:hypothetical protein